MTDRKPPFASVEEALEDIRAGRMIVLVDDEDRENEGDIVYAAEKVTPEAMNFTLTNARGVVCLSLTAETCDRLHLHAELRDQAMDTDDCPERERTLRTVTVRQDSEPVQAADDDWLIEHLGHCAGCGRAHGALLEGSVRYRGWRPAT